MHSKHFKRNVDLLRNLCIGLLKLSKVKSHMSNKSKGGTLTS